MKDSTPRSAKRLTEFQEYFFSKANKLITEVETETGIKVINLGIGSPDLPPPVEIVAALKKKLDNPNNHKYPSYNGDPELKEAIASYYLRRFKVNLNQAEILPLIGSKEGLVNACLAFLNPDDYALVPDPGYPAYSAGPLLAGAKLMKYLLKAENNYLPDLKEIEKLDLAKVKVWWLGYPNNPTGAVASLEDLERYVEFAKKNNLLIFYDNPYSDVYFSVVKPPSILEIKGAKDIAIEFNSFSKLYNLAGWRVGMAISSKELITPLVKVKSNIDTGIFTALQKAIAFGLNELDPSWIEERNSVYKKRADYLYKKLKELDFAVTMPQASLYIWAKSPKLGSTEDLAFKIIKEVQVFITPGTAFGEQGESYFRFSLCQPLEVLEVALERLSKYFKVFKPV